MDKEQPKDWLERHEKFLAFCLLGLGLFSIAVMVYLKPPSAGASNTVGLTVLNTIVGAMTLAFGGAANALFKIITDSEKKSIGQAAADAVASGPAVPVTAPEPLPVTDVPAKSEELPPMLREDA